MRIDLRLPLPVSSGSAAARVADTIVSAPIAELAGSGELVMIELQGALEFEELDPAAVQVIGTLTFEGPKQDRPVLLISHHRLYGKFVDLHQPLAVLQKHERELPVSLDLTSPGAKRRWLEQPWTSDVESAGEEEEEDGDGEGKRVRAVKRARMADDDERTGSAGDVPSSPPPPPGSSPCRTAEQRKKTSAGATAPSDATIDTAAQTTPPQSTAPPASTDPAGEESEDDDDDWDEHASEDEAAGGQGADTEKKRRRGGGRGRRPRVWYDVVCLIRRKILFSQRPEPVVNLAPELGAGLPVAGPAAASRVVAAKCA